jgi:ubiquinone/menaquinone biosynthesis C-methylase UbiE
MTNPGRYEIIGEIGFLGRRRAAYDTLVRAGGAMPGERVLDVGCGTGYLTRRMALAVGPTGSVAGVDPSAPMVEHARRVSPSNCEFHIASAEALPYADAAFDVAVSSLALHHIPRDQRATAMNELARVVRPGGRVLIAEFQPPRNRLARAVVGLVAGRAMQHTAVDEVAPLLEYAGFTITGSGDAWPVLHWVSAVRP